MVYFLFLFYNTRNSLQEQSTILYMKLSSPLPCFLSIVLLIVLGSIAGKHYQYNTLTPHQQENNLLGIEWNNQGEPTLSLMRLSDGAEERLPGVWQISFLALMKQRYLAY